MDRKVARKGWTKNWFGIYACTLKAQYTVLYIHAYLELRIKPLFGQAAEKLATNPFSFLTVTHSISP